jgi:hypothetical protein
MCTIAYKVPLSEIVISDISRIFAADGLSPDQHVPFHAAMYFMVSLLHVLLLKDFIPSNALRKKRMGNTRYIKSIISKS